ncbi:MAG: hypothetical protein HY825_09525 [Acidobacteria bacterium]|nr:hypothetical protein [Acidobacteriota bacterium]
MQYLQVPRAITSTDVRGQGLSWSASMYRRVQIPTRNTKSVGELLSGYDKGGDPGSLYYLGRSTHYLIRTKALQEHSTLICTKGDAITPLNPRAFENPSLSDGDILLSKDSNIGECAMVDGDRWKNHAISGGVVRLRPSIDRFYLFAFLKHPIFREALYSKVPRGSTIAHANTLWLDCRVPFPEQSDADRVERYVSVLMEAIVDKERAIRSRHETILAAIDSELTESGNGSVFAYAFPQLSEVRTAGRYDTGLYCRGFRAFRHRVDHYKHGPTTLSALGVKSRRGSNLAVSVIGRSLYSETPKPLWYELIRPVNISEYGTLVRREWLGNRRRLAIVHRGDLVLGCEGFEKGRSIVLIDDPGRTTTNFHGTAVYWPGATMEQVVWLRCYFAFLREQGVVDWVGVGGSGGHMSPEYFDYLPIPNFPDHVQAAIARLYHAGGPGAAGPPSISEFVDHHHARNEALGIWELDSGMKALQAELAAIQDQIILGRTVAVALPD